MLFRWERTRFPVKCKLISVRWRLRPRNGQGRGRFVAVLSNKKMIKNQRDFESSKGRGKRRQTYFFIARGQCCEALGRAVSRGRAGECAREWEWVRGRSGYASDGCMVSGNILLGYGGRWRRREEFGANCESPSRAFFFCLWKYPLWFFLFNLSLLIAFLMSSNVLGMLCTVFSSLQ